MPRKNCEKPYFTGSFAVFKGNKFHVQREQISRSKGTNFTCSVLLWFSMKTPTISSVFCCSFRLRKGTNFTFKGNIFHVFLSCCAKGTNSPYKGYKFHAFLARAEKVTNSPHIATLQRAAPAARFRCSFAVQCRSPAGGCTVSAASNGNA